LSKLASNLFETIIDRLDVGVFVINENLEVQSWNKYMSSHSGKSSSEVVDRNILELFPEIPERWFKKKVEGVFILKNHAFTSWRQRPYLLRFPHNRPVTGGVEHMFQNCTLIPIKNDEGEVESICITILDVTDEGIAQTLLEEAMLTLEKSSRTDGLTKLNNRSYWESCLHREFKRHDRHECPVSLIMLDLDHFKPINDNYGHLAGDEVLRRVAEVISETARETDIVGRYGGEEFGIILADSDLEAAKGLAERLRHNIEALVIEFGGMEIRMTASQGVAEYVDEIEKHEQLIDRADQALYQSKGDGRNCWTVYPFE